MERKEDSCILQIDITYNQEKTRTKTDYTIYLTKVIKNDKINNMLTC